MMIVKARTGTTNWYVYHKDIGNTDHLVLNTSEAKATASWTWENTTPTESTFHLSSDSTVNGFGSNYIAYLFASLDGVSKVGSYTGTNVAQNIDCGFSSGARFVLIKRATSAGDWVTLDTERGIVAGNDPYLELSTKDAENSGDDVIDPYSSGFTVTSDNLLNLSGETYIFYAIA